MRELQLTNSDEPAIVDAKYYDYLNQFNWRRAGTGYVVRHASLHAEVMRLAGHTNFELLDHINRDRSDNRKENLRPATASQNSQNAGIQRNNTTGYIGVSQSRERLRAVIGSNERFITLGSFENTAQGSVAAAKARDVGAIYFHDPDFVVLNFKRSDYPLGHPSTWPPGPYSDVIRRCRGRQRCNSTSGYWNVGWYSAGEAWVVRIFVISNMVHLGYFRDSPGEYTALLDAVKVADTAAIHLGRDKINLSREHYPAESPRDWPEESIPDCPALRRLIEA